MSDKKQIRRALISVYDKTGLGALARGLHDAGVTIVSTGSTAKTIADAGVPVTPVEDVTGFPEVLDGRVKTLHPKVHAGLLADTRKAEHLTALDELGIEAFELVVVNLYPFSETVASGAAPDECVEQIDIGGPSMVRAAAKNHPSVAVVVEPLGYEGVLAAVRAGGFTLAERKRTRVPRCTAMMRAGRVWRRRSSCTARRCRTTTTPMRMPRGVPRSTTSRPVWPSSNTPTRAESRSRRCRWPMHTVKPMSATRFRRSAA